MVTISSLDWVFPCKIPKIWGLLGRAESWGLVGQGPPGCFPPDTRSSCAGGHSSQAASSSPRGGSSGTNEQAKRPHQGGLGGDPRAAGARETRRPARRGRAGPVHGPPPRRCGGSVRPLSPARRPRPPQPAAGLTLAPELRFPRWDHIRTRPPAPTTRHRGSLARAGFRERAGLSLDPARRVRGHAHSLPGPRSRRPRPPIDVATPTARSPGAER